MSATSHEAPVTLSQVEPDLEAFRATLRHHEPRRVHYFEHGIAPNVQEALRQRLRITETPVRDESTPAQWEREAQTYRRLGFELFRVWLPGGEFAVAGSKGTTWGQEHVGPIQSWEDMDRYPWPDPDVIDLRQLEYYDRYLPPNMAVFHAVKVWEVVRELMGFESFCMAIFERPDLVEAIVHRVGDFHLRLTRMLCQFRCVEAVYGADDFGYRTSTMFAPPDIRRLFLPWHRQMAQIAHACDKFHLFHSCGKIDALMDDLIDTVGIDAKHSFENVIVPVTEAKRRWGDRVALLGGLDVDLIARAQPEVIRQTVRQTLDICQPNGGYCLGLGNWVTSYIPPENYLVVLDEARRYGA